MIYNSTCIPSYSITYRILTFENSDCVIIEIIQIGTYVGILLFFFFKNRVGTHFFIITLYLQYFARCFVIIIFETLYGSDCIIMIVIIIHTRTIEIVSCVYIILCRYCKLLLQRYYIRQLLRIIIIYVRSYC